MACLLEKPNEPDELKDQKPDGREVYEVTVEGLRRAAKKLKLKGRAQLARERGESTPQLNEQKSNQAAKPETVKANPSKNSDDDEEDDNGGGEKVESVGAEDAMEEVPQRRRRRCRRRSGASGRRHHHWRR